jgi:hypothetical protein
MHMIKFKDGPVRTFETLHGAYLHGAVLSGAYLSGAKGLAIFVVAGEGEKLPKGAWFLIIAWAVVFGPFVLMFWLRALAS